MSRLLVVALLICPCVLADDARDLSKYDVIGPFTIGHNGDRLAAQVRQFLWTHWRRHRKGRVVVTTYYVEGMGTSSYFIEPDRDGRWAIVEEVDFRGLFSSKKVFSCAAFERVEPGTPFDKLTRIPDETPRPPEKYLLHPKCPERLPKLW